MILPREFYLGDTKAIAKELLGKRLVRQHGNKVLSGIIVETEAYLGFQDPACHSFHGKRTARVEPMYLVGGHTYVYLIYGMHYCFNIVTGDESRPEAVLIRAIEPDESSVPAMQKLRKVSQIKDLSNGPAKLCQSLEIDKSLNGLDMTKSTTRETKIWIEESPKMKSKIITRPRIGIESKGEAAKWPLRFYLEGNPFVSRP